MSTFDIIVKILSLAETLAPSVIGAVAAFRKAHDGGTTIEALLAESDSRAKSILEKALAELNKTPTV